MGDETSMRLPKTLRDRVKEIAARKRLSMKDLITKWVKQEEDES